MTEANSATSGTERANPPTVSSDSARLFTPARGIAPNVGLKPTMPQYDAGRMIDRQRSEEPFAGLNTTVEPVDVAEESHHERRGRILEHFM